MKTAPDFTLLDQNGNDFNLYNNLDSEILLVFYPKDQSPVCTKQLCSYNDNLEKFVIAGLKVAAINIENSDSHKDFAEKESLNFPLLSDTDKEVSRAYGALNFAGMNKRKIVIISRGKEILYEEAVFPVYFPKVDKILKIIESNKTN